MNTKDAQSALRMFFSFKEHYIYPQKSFDAKAYKINIKLLDFFCGPAYRTGRFVGNNIFK
jgi:hypothetical protein